MFERTPARRKQDRDDTGHSPAHPQDDPLALDPYSPIFVAREPEWNGPQQLALDPYSPIPPRAQGRNRPGAASELVT
jgi:hypothetical protein